MYNEVGSTYVRDEAEHAKAKSRICGHIDCICVTPRDQWMDWSMIRSQKNYIGTPAHESKV
jgi:hypothetical protein